MKKESFISQCLDRHNYPEIFYRYAILVRIIYAVNFTLTLRNWYVRHALRKAEKKQPSGFSFLDAGCGMGEFALRIAKRHRQAHVLGIDFIAMNESLSSHVAQSMNLKNIEFRKHDLTALDISDQYDLILCNSTLQFIKEDEKALKNLHSAMKRAGILILYVPILYRRYFPWSESLEKKYLSDYFYKYHDDFLMHRYDPDEVFQKLRIAGFKINNVEYAYGICGAIAFEMYSLILVAVKILPIIIAIPCLAVYLCTLFPIQLFLMLVDYLIKKSTGNGLLIVAGKE